LALGAGVRFVGEYLYIDCLDAAALLPCLAGLAVLLGGKPALRWAWPAIAFLAFMVPMPFSIQNAMPHPLQRVATLASTCALQTLGLPALAEGNVIVLGETRIGVVEACSGLNMLVIFFALSTAVALLIDRPLWKKLVLVACAVPIALVANVARVTVTVILHETVGHKAADLVFHDLAGWLMMPFALVLLWLELKVLARLPMEVKPVAATVAVPTRLSRAVAAYKSKNRRQSEKTPLFPPLPHGPKKP
jgi:exosortase